MSPTEGQRASLRADAVTYLFARAIPALLQLATVAVFARLLGPREYAVYALASGAAFAFAEVSTQWVQQALVRFAPSAPTELDRSRLRGTLALAITAQTAFAVALGACVIAAAVVARREIGVVSLGVVLAMTTSWFNTVRAYFQAIFAAGRWARYSIASNALRLGVALAVLPAVGRHASSLLLGSIAGLVLLQIPMARAAGLGRGSVTFVGARDDARRWWRYGWPLSGWSASLQILAVADRYMIAWIRNAYAAGLYSSMYDVVTKSLYPLADAIVLAVQPHVMHAQASPDRVLTLVRRSCVYVTMLIAPLASFSIVEHERIVWLLVGHAYIRYSSLVPLLLCGALAWHAASTIQKVLEVTNRTGHVLIAVGSAAVVNVSINIPLILIWGPVGAGVATLVTYALYLAAVHALARRALAWRFPYVEVLRVLASAAVAAPIAWLVVRTLSSVPWVGFFLSVPVALLTYLSALVIVGSIRVSPPRAFRIARIGNG